jgi:antitoxin HigA-1
MMNRPSAVAKAIENKHREKGGKKKIMKILPNIHPGEVLLEEFLTPMGISQNALARAAGVPPRRINEIVLAKRSISADTAVTLARVFGTSERFWLGLQTDYDLEEARRAIGRGIKHIERIAA